MELFKPAKFFYLSVTTILCLVSFSALAEVIGADTVISVPTTYTNTTLDMTHGNFIIRNGASLTIQNSTINGTLSAENPNLISVERGELNLIKNEVNISAASIDPNPKGEASNYVVRMGRATGHFTGNKFAIDKPFTAGLLTTSVILPVQNIQIVNNEFHQFHGVLYLLNSHGSVIEDNYFTLNSSGQIVIVGEHSMITNNAIFFSGMDQLGDAIDIVASDNVTIAKNQIFTPTSIGIAVTLSHNVLIDRNTITGGITYAINILSYPALKSSKHFVASILAKLDKTKLKNLTTDEITIRNNYLGQNRYGIAASDVHNLAVVNNYFTQRFQDAAARKFWTDNDVLLQNITGLTWADNYYKEAFTQVNGGDNSMTQIVPFPASGGVVL